MIVADKCRFVPEAVIVFILKHSPAFEWVCINCQCRGELQGNTCLTEHGKWQRAQGETGLDIVARLARPRHRWFADVDARCTTIILEAKGDRTKAGGVKAQPTSLQ
jgi:hypothetical protein